MVGPASRECVLFLFQVFLKPTLPQGEGRPRRNPSNNEPVGRGMGGSQPGSGGLGHPQVTYMNPKLPTSTLPQFNKWLGGSHCSQ
jgi:hypothetical protein